MADVQRKVVTVMLILMWVSMGLYLEVGGPTMLDLRIKFNSNSEDVARSISGQGFGIFVGAVIAGLFVDLLGSWKMLLVTASAVISTLSIVSMPFVSSLTLLWLMFFMLGISAGMTNVAGQRMLLEMWKEKAPSPMHAMHMGFGIGALVAPIIANPFLAVLKFTETSTTPSSNATTSSPTSSPASYVIVEESRVHLAYITIGIISALISAPFVIYPLIRYFQSTNIETYTTMDSESPQSAANKSYFRRILNTINPATYANGSFKFGLFVFILVFLYFINVVGGEQLFGNFVRTFSVDELKFSRNEASYLDTVYWGAFTIGRFTGSVVSHFVGIRTLFVVDMLLNLLSVTFADIFATKSKHTLWAFTAIVGFFISTLFPAGISFINTQIEVGGVVLTIVVFASGFGHLIYVWIEGVLYQSYGPRTILYAMQAAATLICLIVSIFTLASWRRGDRFQQHSQRLVNNTGDESNGRMTYTKLDQSSTQSEDD